MCPSNIEISAKTGVGYQEFATADIPSQIQPNNHDEIMQKQLKPLKLNGNNQGALQTENTLQVSTLCNTWCYKCMVLHEVLQMRRFVTIVDKC